MSLRHLLLTGGLGTGRKTAAKLIAKALCAVGIFQDESIDYITSIEEGFSRGQVNFVDHAAYLSPFERKFAHLASFPGPQFVILASRTAVEISEVVGKSTFLQKREPERLTLAVPTTSELAQITLQRLADRMTLSADVTVELIQQA